jgi:hypothetical protein
MDKLSVSNGPFYYKRISPTGQVGTAFSGRELKALLRKRGKSRQQRARTTAWLMRLNAQVFDLSAAQFSRLCQANPGAVSIELGHRGKRGPRPSTVNRLLRERGAARPADHADQHGDHHHGDDHHRNGSAVPTPADPRAEARELARVAFGALEKLKSLPTEIWAGAVGCVRGDLKLALKWARMLKSDVDTWCPDPDAGELPEPEMELELPSLVAAE